MGPTLKGPPMHPMHASGRIRPKRSDGLSGESGSLRLTGMGRDRQGAARTLLAGYGRPCVTSPVDAALALLYESAGNVEFLREQVRAHSALIISGKLERDEIAGIVRLYNDERDRLSKLSSDLMRIGIAQRQVSLYEAQARMIVTIVGRIIDRANLDADQRKRAIEAATSELRSITLVQAPHEIVAPYAHASNPTHAHDQSSIDDASINVA